jgi:hypothetical protein
MEKMIQIKKVSHEFSKFTTHQEKYEKIII